MSRWDRWQILAAILIGMGGAFTAGVFRGRELEQLQPSEVASPIPVKVSDIGYPLLGAGADGKYRLVKLDAEGRVLQSRLPKTLPPHNCGDGE